MSNSASTESSRDQSSATDILLVDDDADALALVSRWLEKAGYTVETAMTGEAAMGRLSMGTPRLVITDYIMEEMDGISLLREIQRRHPTLPVIMLSGQAGIPEAVKATNLGALAFLTKPVERGELLEQVADALQRVGYSVAKPDSSFSSGIIYRSGIMSELMDRARMVAAAEMSVYISGSTGSGKEILARVIHAASSRGSKPFIGINCGAIPEQLLESELFGHEKGAFTGAEKQHDGLFRAAIGGTIFLDEIGDMPLTLQIKLLRVLQDFEIRPVGSTRTISVDVRIISATHQDLEKSVERGEFRADLYYRLNVLPLHMPSLAERREDIPLLSSHFLRSQAQALGKVKKLFAPEAIDYLISAPWPGNVRQLQNVINQCVVLSASDVIPLSTVQAALRDQSAGMQTLDQARKEFERNYIVSVLRITGGNVASATKIAGRNRTDFYKLLNRHNIDPAAFRKSKSDG